MMDVEWKEIFVYLECDESLYWLHRLRFQDAIQISVMNVFVATQCATDDRG